MEFARRDLPVTESLCSELLSLPIEITNDQQTRVIEELEAIVFKLGG
jgi:dTDP-4-amino-4,6-dideoxygalactose transaminase